MSAVLKPMENLDIAFVETPKVMLMASTLLPFLFKSQERTNGRSTAEDIFKYLINGQMACFVVFDADTVYGYVVVEPWVYPRRKLLRVQYCSGDDHHMQYIEDKMFMVLEEYARQLKCNGIEFTGRAGWLRVVQKYGYERESCNYMKELS